MNRTEFDLRAAYAMLPAAPESDRFEDLITKLSLPEATTDIPRRSRALAAPLVAAALVVLLTVGALLVARSRPGNQTAQDAALVTSAVARVTLQHPQQWRYIAGTSNSFSTAPAVGYLTDQPTISPCSTPANNAAGVDCRASLPELRRSGVVVTVASVAQTRQSTKLVPNAIVAGYPARTSSKSGLNHCPPGTTLSRQIELETGSTKGIFITILACFSHPTADDLANFTDMVHSLSVA